MKEASYAILGMGRYGCKMAQTLTGTGAQVLIADSDNDIINQYADKVTLALTLDMSNPSALQGIGLERIDVAIVDLSDHLEESIVSIMVAKEQGVKRVIATARSDRYREVMLRVGADEVVIPEDSAAAQMARLLILDDFMTYFDIGGDLCVLKAQPKKEWAKKSLRKLKLREEQINIIAIDRNGEMDIDIKPETVLPEGCPVVLTIPKSRIYDLI